MLRKLIPDSFIATLFGAILIAAFFPVSGNIAIAVNSLATLAIVLLFFFHGAKLERKQIVQGITHWRLHTLILASTFLVFPILGLLAYSLFSPSFFAPPLWVGILFLCLLPSTVQSSIAFTSMAKGNVPAAIASASASQLFGVFLTPLLVATLLGGQSDLSLASLQNLFLIIFLPFIVGHFLRPVIGQWVGSHTNLISVSDKSAILLAVFSAFSAATIDGLWSRVSPSLLIGLLGFCLVLFLLVLLITLSLGKLFNFSLQDRIVILFCGSKKSLVQGVPMAKILFSGPDLGLILLPVMIFHQMQLAICAWVAHYFSQRHE